MTYLTVSIILTAAYYSVVAYMAYVSASILQQGLAYRLIFLIMKTSAFLSLCYISIISDVYLFHSSQYGFVTVKNGFLLVLVTTSLLNARARKGTQNESSRK